jgi:LCP family protein required for cell wall assembly
MTVHTLPPELNPRGPYAPPPARGSGVRRVLAWVAGVTAVAVLAVAGLGWLALTYFDAKITRVDVGLGGPPPPGEPLNILLVGSDSRAGLSQAERNQLKTGNEATKRSDTMILAHVSADNGVTMVSFPRDSFVTIPAHTSADGDSIGESKNKLNAAFAFGGPELTIKTIEANTGLTVDHYVEIDIAGFVNVVDALGGAQVCVKEDVFDKDSGLDLSAGKHTLNGDEALAYVRARKIYADSDLGRIRAQQAFLGSLVRKAVSADTLTDPLKLNRFLSASLGSVTTDSGLGQGQLLALADRLRATGSNQVRFATVPTSDLDYRVDGVGSAVLWDDVKSEKLFTALANDEPIVKPAPKPTSKVVVPPGEISVRTQNGTSIAGLARKAAESMAGAGFGIDGAPTNADRTDYTRTTITYDPRYEKSLATLTAALPDAETVAVEGLGETFVVIAGTDWTGAKKVTVATATPAAVKDDLDTTTAQKSICT